MTTINQNPTISDLIQFTITTTDSSDNLVNPDTVDSVTIYFIERSFFDGNSFTDTITKPERSYETFFNEANPVTVLGDENGVAWGNTASDLITNVSAGTFSFNWQPNHGSGDYYVCWKWTISGNQSASFYQFYISGDTKETTSIPTHYTAEGKYETLLDKYLPSFIKLQFSENDITPDIVHRYNLAVAKMFTEMEDQTNQMVDLLDANVTPKSILPYLGNLFNLKLRSRDSALWRKQIKTAVSLYKKKGTLGGLTESLLNTGIILNSFTMLWQIVSSVTWQEGLKIATDGQLTFALEKLAMSYNVNNFSISIRPVNTSSYISLVFTDYVTLSNSGGITTLTWIGETAGTPIILAAGDFLDIIYQVSTVTNQSTENYIRLLPLADTRDETTVTYPLKNWNVRLIAENDSMFDVICNVKHPFVNPLVYGKIRTEFPYSENIYNMDEYNGSIRDSNDPCDLDKSFLDSCSCCRSSKFNANLSIDDISDDRISEANEIIREFKPFHLIPQSITYSGSLNDIMVPPVEDINFLIQYSGGEETLVSAEGLFNRHMPLSGGQNSSFNAPLRNQLASSSVVISGVSGTGHNQRYIIFAPHLRFDSVGVSSSNLLEILSGTSAGNYTATYLNSGTIQVNQASPSSLSFPLEAGEHHFRLSNIIYTDPTASIYQDNLFIFNDTNLNFNTYPVASGWKVTISNGTNPGTYIINKVLSNNTVLLTGWPGSNISGLHYQLKDSLNNIITSGTVGQINITLRGRLELPDDIYSGFGVREGYFVLYSGTQYKISDFNIGSKPYLIGYNSGNIVGSASIKILKRLIDNDLGFLDVDGMYLVSGVNYETGLGILDGNTSNRDGMPDADSKFKENYFILISGNYYKIIKWSGNNIYLEGPKVSWGLSGTSVPNYSIILITKTPDIIIADHIFRKVDRSGNDVITITEESVGSMLSYSGSGFADNIGQSENIQIIIQKV